MAGTLLRRMNIAVGKRRKRMPKLGKPRRWNAGQKNGKRRKQRTCDWPGEN